MLQKFALALKTKTVEFFAEEEEEDEEVAVNSNDLDSAEEIITGQRVVVLKPDNPNKPEGFLPPHQLQHALVSSLFAAVSSFHASYLHLQTAHEPFQHDNIEAADRMAVSHLQRLSDIRRAYCGLLTNPGVNPCLPLSSHLEAQVQENQSMLRRFETVFNRLQSDIDQKDLEVSALKQQWGEIEASNSKLEDRLDRWVSSTSDQDEQVLLPVRIFDSVLKEACRMAHRFAKNLIDLMKKSGWDLHSAANCIYPNVDYEKRGHCRYAILSYICLAMFGDFGSSSFGLEDDGAGPITIDLSAQRRDFLRQFLDHLSIDSLELLSTKPESEFAKFCEKKYRQLIRPELESSLIGKFGGMDSVLGSLRRSSSLYEPFVNMGSSIWLLHKLALAFSQRVEIFQVGQGAEFSMVYMESVIRTSKLTSSDGRKARPKVGFTVVPGFRVGSTVVQCRVYLDCMS